MVWSLINLDVLTRLLNRAETITVEGSTGSGDSAARRSRELQLVTLLPFDAIRSIEDPVFLQRSRADALYASDELVLGIEINGDARAYSVPLLSRHEVVNDTVGGKPIAVTW